MLLRVSLTVLPARPNQIIAARLKTRRILMNGARKGMIAINEKVSTRTVENVGIIVADHAPVNALSLAVRDGLVQAIAVLNADPAVHAIVLGCAGRTFFAGADITEFGRPRLDPTLQDVVATIERSAKPVVAAIHGTALGGGFEVALGCHYRVAVTSAVVGLPEITLGLFAGGGGTKRLPRLIGPEEALKFCLSGERIPAAAALAMGILDEVGEGDPVTVAIEFTRKIIGKPVMPVRDRDEKLAATRAKPEMFEKLAEQLTKGKKGEDAPAANVKSIRESFTLPFDEGLALDAVANRELMAGSQSRALRHLFFAEREASKIPGIPAGVKARKVATAAVVGAGTMGGGIAMCFANAGIPVTLIDATEEALARGIERVKNNYATSVKRGSLSHEAMDRRMGLISGAVTRSGAADADIVIEAVFEDEALKREIFSDLSRQVKAGTLLASNTSAIDVDLFAQVLDRPGEFCGMHFFSPANVMKLLEIVKAKASDPETLLTAMEVGRRIGKVPVVSGNCDGFIGNRMVAKRSAQVDLLLQKGAMPDDVDGALKSFGFPMGPLAINDMSGLDVGWSIRKRRGTPFPVADAICERGWFGQKTGQGYYRYEAGSREPLPNPEVKALILEISAKRGIERSAMARTEMIERMLYPLINEGARILEEGIAYRASDIDLVWINGYGWPRITGGPMFYADEVGLRTIVARLDAFAADTPSDPSLKPAALLRDLADAGSSFAAWQKSQKSAAQGDC
jgi:3-hydroxyacyl-CoA dehydrogenase